MQYPLISEYIQSIQNAADNLDKLSNLSPIIKDQMPFHENGATSVVFKMRDVKTKKKYALKCFTKEQDGREKTYKLIADELEKTKSDYFTSVKYLENEILVDNNHESHRFPVLLMDWAKSNTMKTYISKYYADQEKMAMLCFRFCQLAAWLRSQPFAHGDINTDNIIVQTDGMLTLVDYDGMFVPSMKGWTSPTIGTKNFCHPMRTEKDFDETIDDFSLASIALSLKAISLNPNLFERYSTADSLLFSADDYLNLSRCEVLKDIQSLIYDVDINTLLSLFLSAHANYNLASVSFKIFNIENPELKTKESEESVSTIVTAKDFENAITDEFGVKYSNDSRKLLKAPNDIKGIYTIRKGTKYIYNRAFEICNRLEQIIIPDSVITIEERAFRGCNKLSKINIPDSVTSIGDCAFSDCYSLTQITIPNSVTSIGESAFYDCSGLSQINIPNSITNVCRLTFNKCRSLKQIDIPNSVISIGAYAFCNCSALAHITIPNSVTNIGEWAFKKCDSLAQITIPDSIASINKGIFYGCCALTRIYIPESVISIGESAFKNCSALTRIYIPESVISIGESAFKNCSALKEIHISKRITRIEKSTFWGCIELTHIDIPKRVGNIAHTAFNNCNSLEQINISHGTYNKYRRMLPEYTNILVERQDD